MVLINNIVPQCDYVMKRKKLHGVKKQDIMKAQGKGRSVDISEQLEEN